ncbi:MAG: flippase-like domain-containing protein [Candidatus Aminicenantes bacterium]|nr:flippase-like domain-containing protein [Candidatus Aminicenantes bacterium]
MTRKQLGWLVVKIIVSLSLLVYILAFRASPADVVRRLAGINPLWLGVAVSLHVVGLVVSAYRWQILARAQGDDLSLGYLVRSYLVGTFFNNFLPTRFGGDVIRIWDGSKPSRSLVKSSAVVVVERVTGLIILFLFALTASLFRLDMARRIPVIWVSLLAGLAGLLAAAFFLSPFAGRLLGRLSSASRFGRIASKVLGFRDVIVSFRRKRGPFLLALAWALVLQVNVILYYFLIGRALGMRVPLVDYFVFIPVVLLLQTIPVTLGGLGLRESAYVAVFRFYGVSAETAVSFSLVGDVAVGLAVGLVGGIIYVTRK